jgi:hypothetical protein
MGRNHWSRCVGLTRSSTDRTASPQSSSMFYSQRAGRQKHSKYMALHALIPNLPTASPKRHPVIHAWSKPEGAVSGRPFLPTVPKTGKIKILSLPRARGSAEIADQGLHRWPFRSVIQVPAFRPTTRDPWEKKRIFRTCSHRPRIPQTRPVGKSANGHALGFAALGSQERVKFPSEVARGCDGSLCSAVEQNAFDPCRACPLRRETDHAASASRRRQGETRRSMGPAAYKREGEPSVERRSQKRSGR